MTHATTHDPHPTDRRTDEYERAMRLFHERSLTAAARMLRAEDYEAPMRRLLTAEDKKIMARMEQCHYARFYSGSEENAVYRDQDEIDKYLPQELSRRAKSIRCRIPYLKDATYDEFEEATNLNRAKENFERLAAGVAGESPIAAAPGKRPGFAPLDPKERTPSTFRRRSVSELLSTEWVEPTALVTDPRGRLLIAATDPLLVHGDWRSGKTWMLLDLAISLATGLPLFDHFPVSEPKRVVYIGAEGTPGSFADRLEQLLKIRGLTHDDLGGRLALIIMSDQEADTYLTIDDPESVGDLIADLGEDTPDVLMIDPLANFMRGEETNDGMKVVVQQVRRITQALGTQVFVAHHDVKNSETYNKASKRSRGGGALAAGMGTLSLEGEKKDDGWLIRVQNDPKEGQPIPQFEVRWITADDDDRGRPRLVRVDIDAGVGRQLTETQSKIITALEGGFGGPRKTLRDVATLSKISKSSVDRAVRDLLKLNLIEKDEDGYTARPEAEKRNEGGWRVAYGR